VSVVEFRRDGPVGVITLDRPPVNAYDAAMHEELTRAWRAAAADADVRVVVLCAEGPHFCAGADLTAPVPEPAAGASAPWDELTFVRNLPKPTIAAVQGGCIGGGQRFVFPCDLVFCADDAFFRDPLASMGVGGIQAPVHTWLYGPRLAKEMLFSGMRVGARRLYEMGAVNRLYPRDELREATMAFAREIASVDASALRQAKRAVNTTMDLMGQHHVASRFADLLDGPESRFGR